MMTNDSAFARCHAAARAALLLVLLIGPTLPQAQVILANEVRDPRTFGYAVGDKLRREVYLSVHPDYRLDEASLPKAGRLDRWLELAAPELHAESDANGRHYRLILTYQLFNAPLALETVTIPQQDIRLVDNLASRSQTTLVPALRITVAPLTSAVRTNRLSGASLQEDRPPVPLPFEARQYRLVWTAAALLLLLLFAAWRRGLLAFVARKNLPFAKAVRELRRLQPESGAPMQYRAALKIVHEAINRTAGRAVFAHNLDEFMAAHAEYAALRKDFEQLFAASGSVFFGHAAGDAPSASAPPSLLRLCQHCRRIERRTFDLRSSGQLAAGKYHVPGN